MLFNMSDIHACRAKNDLLYDPVPLETLGSEPLTDVVHNQALHDNLVATLVHTDFCSWVCHHDVGLERLQIQK